MYQRLEGLGLKCYRYKKVDREEHGVVCYGVNTQHTNEGKEAGST